MKNYQVFGCNRNGLTKGDINQIISDDIDMWFEGAYKSNGFKLMQGSDKSRIELVHQTGVVVNVHENGVYLDNADNMPLSERRLLMFEVEEWLNGDTMRLYSSKELYDALDKVTDIAWDAINGGQVTKASVEALEKICKELGLNDG